MKIPLKNKVCSYPTLISGFCGTFGSIFILIAIVYSDADLALMLKYGPEIEWSLLFSILSFGSLGFIVGNMVLGSPARKYCSRYNGAPYKIGDNVVIIQKKFNGEIYKVLQLQKSQGGWPLVCLELDEEEMKNHGNVFEEYEIVNLKKIK